MKNVFVWPLVIFLVLGAAAFAYTLYAPSAPGGIACTTEAKLCPDGSYVGRTGPNCEFTACPEPTPTTTPTSTPTTGDLTLGVGQKGTVGELSVTFNSFVQDSRCPIDVQCIQAGAVNINVTFTKGTQMVTKNMPSDEVPQEFGGYKISITKIAPPRVSKTEINPKDYVITFHISQ